MAKTESEKMSPVIKEINEKIKEFGKKNKFDMILGTKDGNIVYSKKKYDISKEVIDFLNTHSDVVNYDKQQDDKNNIEKK